MKTINLRWIYTHYRHDEFVEVSDEVWEVMRQAQREMNNYERRKVYHRAYYSLDAYPPCREMRQKEHSEPEELTETAQAVKVGFSGQEYRGMQSLCAGYRGAAPCWGQGAKPIGGLRAAAPSGQG